MPSIKCKCGEKLCYGEIPNPIEWLAISDVEYESYEGVIDAEKLYREMKSILKCPSCSRLWVFWNGFDSAPDSYAPEI